MSTISIVQTRVVIREEIRQPGARDGEWRLAFQKVRYIYSDGSLEDGYRFIWYRPEALSKPPMVKPASRPYLKHCGSFSKASNAAGTPMKAMRPSRKRFLRKY